MSFKFDFGDVAVVDDVDKPGFKDTSVCSVTFHEELGICCEVHVNWEKYVVPATLNVTEYHLLGGVTVRCLVPADVEAEILAQREEQQTDGTAAVERLLGEDQRTDGTAAVERALAINSDLVPHVYEGGLKIWECSVDLMNYLSTLDFDFSSVDVLELGCGTALPGLFALRGGASVDFQDYNEDVINRITIPNVAINTSRDVVTSLPRCRFFAGDWAGLADVVATHGNRKRYDVILTAETVYNPECYERLHGTMDSLLKPHGLVYDVILTAETVYNPECYERLHGTMDSLLKPHGLVYLAAKVCYFGVGGGSQDFTNYVRHRGVFNTEVVQSFKGGVERESLKLTFKSHL